jgi:hypothetical protein
MDKSVTSVIRLSGDDKGVAVLNDLDPGAVL